MVKALITLILIFITMEAVEPKAEINQTMKIYIDHYGNIFMKENITTGVDLLTDGNQTKIITK